MLFVLVLIFGKFRVTYATKEGSQFFNSARICCCFVAAVLLHKCDKSRQVAAAVTYVPYFILLTANIAVFE